MKTDVHAQHQVARFKAYVGQDSLSLTLPYFVEKPLPKTKTRAAPGRKRMRDIVMWRHPLPEKQLNFDTETSVITNPIESIPFQPNPIQCKSSLSMYRHILNSVYVHGFEVDKINLDMGAPGFISIVMCRKCIPDLDVYR